MKKTNINHLHSLQQEVSRALAFYAEELHILEERLAEIANHYTGQEVLEGVEHFQNQFLIQLDQIAILKHEVNVNEDAIKAELLESPDFVWEDTAAANAAIYEKYLTAETIINNLRKEFNRFAAKWM